MAGPTRAPTVARRALPALALAAWALAACGSHQAGEPEARVRGVVLFVVDTLRADALGCYGAPGDPTPAMDALAAEGLRFERAYAQATHTHAAMAAMLTGLYPHHNGVLAQGGLLADGVEPLAARLRAAGVATGAFVAAHCTAQERERSIFHEGWDERFCLRDDSPDQHAWDRAVVGAASRWIAEQDGPFLAWVHLYDPHAEHHPPPEHWDYAARPQPGKLEQRELHRRFEVEGRMPDPETRDELLALYEAEVRGADERLAELLALVDALPGGDGVAVVLTADHGEELYETVPRLAHGRVLTEGVLRVPLVVRAPGVEPGVVEDPVETLQVAPTVLALLGVPAGRADGPSLLAERPSDGLAASYYGDLVTVRRGDLRGWLASDALPRDPAMANFDPYDAERPLPWHEAPAAAARYGPDGMPEWLPADALDDPALRERLWGPLEAHLRRLRPVGSWHTIRDADFAAELRDLGYL